MTEACLYVVATPIGNLADISPRALEILGSVALIAAEDTRHTARLLQHYGIETPTVSLHEHNEREVVPRLIAKMHAGESLALVSDAGTPLISDPGFHLIQAAHDAGLKLSPIPGPSAVLAALSVCGLPTDRFVFEGFLPAKPGERRHRLEALREETRTLVLFESSHRIAHSLADMVEVFGGQRRGLLARELTKTFETLRRGPLEVLASFVADDPNQQKGEFVVIVSGADAAQMREPREQQALELLRLLVAELPVKKAVQITTQSTGLAKNWVYEQALRLKSEGQ